MTTDSVEASGYGSVGVSLSKTNSAEALAAASVAVATRSKEEIRADAERRIAAAKEAMAKVAAEQKKESLLGAVATTVQKEPSVSEMPDNHYAAKNDEQLTSSSFPLAEGGDAISTAAVSSSTSSHQAPLDSLQEHNRDSRQRWWPADASLSSAASSSSQVENLSTGNGNGSFMNDQIDRRNSARVGPPLEVFTRALGEPNHGTPLVALISFASVALSALAPLVQQTHNTHRLGSAIVAAGNKLVCGRGGGGGKQLLAGTSRSGRTTQRSSNSSSAFVLGGHQISSSSSSWDVALDLILAPFAPLLASTPGNGAPSAASFSPAAANLSESRMNKYDAVLDILKNALDAPGVVGDEKYSPVRAILDLAPPQPGVARYDFVRNLIREMVADGGGGGDGPVSDNNERNHPYDMIQDLLQVRKKENKRVLLMI